ncbi:hypothetical protein SESBI_38782 [Sesbania bispinosa]|nr:hypothetical protein SESBI_38782 [Sesbania bispinosa]
MAGERTLLEYITPNPDIFASSIFIPQVEENNLDLKPTLINMIQNSLQFGGTPSEDPNSHIRMHQLVQVFYKGLSIANRSMIDAACGGGILRRPPAEIYRIMGDLASNTYQWASQDKQVVKKKETPAGMYHVDLQTM